MDEQKQEKQPILNLPPVKSGASAGSGESLKPLENKVSNEINKAVKPESTASDDPSMLPQVQNANDPGSAQQDPRSSDDSTNSTVTSAVDPDGLPQIADDVDLIEKEWVEKAKDIIEKTKDDPKAQKDAITVVKNDYQKKRFNRSALPGKGS